MAWLAAFTRARRKSVQPALVIRPELWVMPLSWRRVPNPAYPTSFLAVGKRVISAMAARMVMAVSMATPGSWISRGIRSSRALSCLIYSSACSSCFWAKTSVSKSERIRNCSVADSGRLSHQVRCSGEKGFFSGRTRWLRCNSECSRFLARLERWTIFSRRAIP